jgi:hypothetical protein
MGKGFPLFKFKKDKRTTHYTENRRLRNTNSLKPGINSGAPKGKQFLFH